MNRSLYVFFDAVRADDALDAAQLFHVFPASECMYVATDVCALFRSNAGRCSKCCFVLLCIDADKDV